MATKRLATGVVAVCRHRLGSCQCDFHCIRMAPMTRNVAVVDQGGVDLGRWKISLASATAPLQEEGVDA